MRSKSLWSLFSTWISTLISLKHKWWTFRSCLLKHLHPMKTELCLKICKILTTSGFLEMIDIRNGCNLRTRVTNIWYCVFHNETSGISKVVVQTLTLAIISGNYNLLHLVIVTMVKAKISLASRQWGFLCSGRYTTHLRANADAGFHIHWPKGNSTDVLGVQVSHPSRWQVICKTTPRQEQIFRAWFSFHHPPPSQHPRILSTIQRWCAFTPIPQLKH